MKFGIREVCDVTFTKLSGVGPGSFTVDTAKMSTLEGASTTVYAQGGKGNSRHMAWEGEKTITFTLEDALITLDAFHALTGADKKTDSSGKTTTYTIKTTSFAGVYRISASTLFRDEDGKDHSAIINIPKAKLQSNLNLSMAPTGDPASFTYTFDALADSETNALFTITVDNDEYISADYAGKTVVTIINTQGVPYTLTTDKDAPGLYYGETMVSLDDDQFYDGDDMGPLTNGTVLLHEDTQRVPLEKGSTSTWYII